MKRDMDLIRLILLEIENSEPYEILRLDLCGYEDSEVNYHLAARPRNTVGECLGV